MKEKITWNNIRAYIQGWSRYYLYYSKALYGIDLSWLIRRHIHQQIDIRINSMDRKCYIEGSCKECGCATTALQMTNKSCKGNCYPKMMNKKDWKKFSTHFLPHTDSNNNKWGLTTPQKFIKL